MKFIARLLGLLFMCTTPLFSNPCPLPKVIILLGAPGAGKGTQAIFLKETYGLAHISTGDLFRENIKLKTPIGEKAKSYIDKGELVPDAIVLDMLFNRLKAEDCKMGFILDGSPRTLAQAEEIDKRLGGCSEMIAVSLEVPDAIILERLIYRRSCELCKTPYHLKSCPPEKEGICDRCGGALIQRKDDQESVIQERLATFHRDTEPLKDYYKKKGMLYLVDSSISKEETQCALRALLDPLLLTQGS